MDVDIGVREAALLAQQYGLSPVPIRRATKGGLRAGWTERPFNVGDYDDEVNLGIHWQDEWMDVDLDKPLAVQLAPALLPSTDFRYGRPSKPDSHRVYKVTGARKTKKFAFNGMIVEVRGAGAQSVIPPSTHTSGEPYLWSSPAPFPPAAVIDYDRLVALCGRIAAATILVELWPSVPRHLTALALSGLAAKAGWEPAEVEDFITAICTAADDDELADRLTCVADTYLRYQSNEDVAGDSQLQELLPEKEWKKIRTYLQVRQERVRTSLEGTDVGNGQMFAALTRGRVQYCDALGGWIRFNGRCWETDTLGDHRRQVHLLLEDMVTAANAATDRSVRDALFEQAAELSSTRRIDSMLKEARPHLSLPLDLFDRDPLKLTVQNGTIDLRTGALSEHDPEDYISRMSSAHHDPALSCPQWLAFLSRIMNDDQEMLDYLQRVVGYSLTGLTREQCLFFFFGAGKNGKSTFISVMEHLLGDFALKIAMEVLIETKDVQRHGPQLARLPGARFVSSREVDAGRFLAEGLVKDLTGSDRVSAERKYHDPFEFKPQFKLFIYGNHKPRVKGRDLGIWRRIHIVPFEVVIPDNEQVKDYEEVLWAEEGPGILNWAIEGCLKWQKSGLHIPQRIKDAVAEYQEEQDDLSDFLESVSEAKAGAKYDYEFLYLDYINWTSTVGEKPLPKRALGNKLRDHGYKSLKSNGSVYWLGLERTDASRSVRASKNGSSPS